MAYIADLHIHSRFSRACSPQLNVSNLAAWAKLKGLNVLGTGDFLHPLWFAELKSQLIEDGSGFLSYPKDPSVKFVLSVEVASIYTHKGAVCRIHNVIFLPSFDAAAKLQQNLLAKRANISSDGRPIVGISSKELLRMCLEIDKTAIFIPAHIWTPWFGVFGSQSGYDCLQDCFEDLSGYVYGIETGLSSDPAMNWRIKELDNRSIISCSDAHSLPNLGREATVFDLSEFTYDCLFKAISQPHFVIPAKAGIHTNNNLWIRPRAGGDRVGDDKVLGTIEFYPEEGKYHYTGHRNCNIKYSPEDTKEKGTKCPVCSRELTVGVMERVEAIAERSNEELKIENQEGMIESKTFPGRAGYKMLVPLLTVLAESFNTAPTTQKVLSEYKKLTDSLGSEIKILTKVGIEEIAKVSGSKIAEGIDKDRRGDLVIDPGYDGVYGVVKIWGNQKKEELKPIDTPQLELF